METTATKPETDSNPPRRLQHFIVSIEAESAEGIEVRGGTVIAGPLLWPVDAAAQAERG